MKSNENTMTISKCSECRREIPPAALEDGMCSDCRPVDKVCSFKVEKDHVSLLLNTSKVKFWGRYER